MKKQITKYSDIYLAAGKLSAESKHPYSGDAIRAATNCWMPRNHIPSLMFFLKLFDVADSTFEDRDHRLMAFAFAHTLAVEGEELAERGLMFAARVADHPDADDASEHAVMLLCFVSAMLAQP
jgi:hypothetical protein